MSRPLVQPRVWGSLFAAPRLQRGLFLFVLTLTVLAAASAPSLASATSSAPALPATPAGTASPGTIPFTPAATPEPLPSSTYAPGTGGSIFAQNCAGCHGPRGEGFFGPPLAPAGFASLVEGMVRQGGIQMPPFAEALTTRQIDAVAGYVAQELADPASHAAEAANGGQIFRLYCAGCHSTTGRGGALTRGRNAPNISLYPPAEALAAMILGRGNMPSFAGTALDVRQQTSVGLYVEVLDDPPSPGGRGLGYLGPVPEGAAGGGALLILIFIAVWLAWKSREARA